MIAVIMGPPGSGKGTQADLLFKKYGYLKVSTGDAIRKQIKLKSSVGNLAQDIVAKGGLVPDDIIFQMVRIDLEASKGKMVILDGFPRNIAQAEMLESLNREHPVTGCIHLMVDHNVLIERLSGRRLCPICNATFHIHLAAPKLAGICDKCGSGLIQRDDDTEASIRVRLEIYNESSAPIIEFYKSRGIYFAVSGEGDQSDIFDEISAIVEEMTG
ncbi:MAG: nucleoside monophosphate kinase [Proteobacteria bacterium]|nr:nucleoside monophosphate kinase [Pseudomonadota bacterium]